jgi:hypothetical protein
MLDHHIAIDSQNDYNSQLTKWLYQPSCEPTPQFDADRHRNGLIFLELAGSKIGADQPDAATSELIPSGELRPRIGIADDLILAIASAMTRVRRGACPRRLQPTS